ncbi:MAG: aminotransferase class IV, partial [Flavobacteriaceae bacterium]|nr:aminotransferase class IV [Flavobacteriaceae bacterium]
PETAKLECDNRGFNYGDAAFETLKYTSGRLLFWEEHYFRLMATMRILRMEIPMNFTMEFLEQEIIETVRASGLSDQACRIKFIVNRKSGGLYTPLTNEIDYLIKASPIESGPYMMRDQGVKMELYKDYFMPPGLLSNLKTNNRLINILGGIYAQDQEVDNCFILNTAKMVIEALNGNVFLIKGNTIKTPPLIDGCLKGIMRNQIIEIIGSDDDLDLDESSISPFELQKADEIFITNVISGIVPVSQYRKKTYSKDTSLSILAKLNSKVFA